MPRSNQNVILPALKLYRMAVQSKSKGFLYAQKLDRKMLILGCPLDYMHFLQVVQLHLSANEAEAADVMDSDHC